MVVVLGGGVCGLYAALTLVRAGVPVTVIEKESVVGGLATSFRRGNNYYDLGVHMLHEFDEEIYEDVTALMKEESIDVQLNAQIRWAGSFYRYPLQFRDIVRGMSPLTLARMIGGLLTAQLWGKISPSEAEDAEEALIQLYGRPLYKFFFKDFTHRYWGVPPHELSATFIRSKMPRLTAADAIKKVLAMVGIKEKKGHAVESALSEETLHYSPTGAESMPRCIAAEIVRLGGKILTNARVDQVHVDDDRVVGVTYHDTVTGQKTRLDCDFCISTMPLPWMVKSVDPVPPTDVLNSCDQLRYKPIAVYGLLVKKPRALNALYVYYRDRIFHRVGEPKNAGLVVEPRDHTTLIVETTCEVGDPKWNGDASIREKIVEDLEAEGICNGSDIVEMHLLRSVTGYPFFLLGFEDHFERVESYLKGIAHLQSTGRQGGFCYPNMHKAMRMGADAAEAVLREIDKADVDSSTPGSARPDQSSLPMPGQEDVPAVAS